jgi:hypothetical protein
MDDRRRRHRQRCAPGTESGVQVDSSVTHQLRVLIKALSWFYFPVSMVVLGQLWPAFDGLATA